jgi:hypothetical protein
MYFKKKIQKNPEKKDSKEQHKEEEADQKSSSEAKRPPSKVEKQHPTGKAARQKSVDQQPTSTAKDASSKRVKILFQSWLNTFL